MFGAKRDQRDLGFGLAGLNAALHALRIMAERGVATNWDISQAQVGIRSALATVPDGQADPELMARLDQLITDIGVAAATTDRRTEDKS